MGEARHRTEVGSGPTADEETATTTWTTECRGLRRLPQRLRFTIADFSRRLWWTTVVLLPVALLAGVLLVGELFVYLYFGYAAVLLMTLSMTSERFCRTTVELDHGTGELAVTYHMGEPSLFGGDRTETLSLTEVDAARLVAFGSQTLVKANREGSFGTEATVVVPNAVADRLRDALGRHDVALDEQTLTPFGWVHARCLVTAVTLGAIPLVGLVVWPAPYAWMYLLVVLLHAVVLPRQGP